MVEKLEKEIKMTINKYEIKFTKIFMQDEDFLNRIIEKKSVVVFAKNEDEAIKRMKEFEVKNNPVTGYSVYSIDYDRPQWVGDEEFAEN